MMYFTSIQMARQIGRVIEHCDTGRTFPVSWVDSYIFGFDEEFIIADFRDRLFLHSNGFCLESNLVLVVMTKNKRFSHRLDYNGVRRGGQLNLGGHGRLRGKKILLRPGVGYLNPVSSM